MEDMTRDKMKRRGREVLLSIQHMFAMFGATILVPLLTGFSTSVALVTAGIGTLVFHLLTKCKVPVFLGSSFAYIPSLITVVSSAPDKAIGLRYAQGGIMLAGAVYVLLSIIVYFVGAERVKKFLPPIVTGPIIIVIAMSLAKNAIYDAFSTSPVGAPFAFNGINLAIALVSFAVVVIGMIFAKGFFKLVPILLGIVVGYVLSAILGACGVFQMNYQAVIDAPWFNIPYYTQGFFTLPMFSWSAVIAIAPIALVTFMEHIGDITTNGMVVGKDFFQDPGLHRTVLGDGMATLISGFFGGPAETTYSENTGVLATTKNYNPRILRMTAVFAIILGFFGKFGAILQTIPLPVRGGIEMILFGMIASVGIRTLAESKLDFTQSRNLLIIGVTLTVGIGFSMVGGINIGSFNLSSLFIATIIAILLNLLLPKKLEKSEEDGSDVAQFENKEFDIVGIIGGGIKKLFAKTKKNSKREIANCDKVEDGEVEDNTEVVEEKSSESVENNAETTLEKIEANAEIPSEKIEANAEVPTEKIEK